MGTSVGTGTLGGQRRSKSVHVDKAVMRLCPPYRSVLLQRQIEAHRAFELALGGTAGEPVDLELPLFAIVIRFQIGGGAAFDRLFAALLDEGAEYRSLALIGRKIGTIPAVAAVARGEEVAQQIGFL